MVPKKYLLCRSQYDLRYSIEGKGKTSSTYQFKDFVNLKLLALLGTFEIAIT